MSSYIEDLKRIKRYVDDVSLGEYGFRDPEGRELMKLLDDMINEEIGAQIVYGLLDSKKEMKK